MASSRREDAVKGCVLAGRGHCVLNSESTGGQLEALVTIKFVTMRLRHYLRMPSMM